MTYRKASAASPIFKVRSGIDYKCLMTGSCLMLPVWRGQSALTCLEARVLLVDHINTATTTYYTVCAVTSLQGLERVLDFHGTISVR